MSTDNHETEAWESAVLVELNQLRADLAMHEAFVAAYDRDAAASDYRHRWELSAARAALDQPAAPAPALCAPGCEHDSAHPPAQATCRDCHPHPAHEGRCEIRDFRRVDKACPCVTPPEPRETGRKEARERMRDACLNAVLGVCRPMDAADLKDRLTTAIESIDPLGDGAPPAPRETQRPVVDRGTGAKPGGAALPAPAGYERHPEAPAERGDRPPIEPAPRETGKADAVCEICGRRPSVYHEGLCKPDLIPRAEAEAMVAAERERLAQVLEAEARRRVDIAKARGRAFSDTGNTLCGAATIVRSAPASGAGEVRCGGYDRSDLQRAFVYGAREARENPKAGEHDFDRASDAYVKLKLSGAASK